MNADVASAALGVGAALDLYHHVMQLHTQQQLRATDGLSAAIEVVLAHDGALLGCEVALPVERHLQHKGGEQPVAAPAEHCERGRRER